MNDDVVATLWTECKSWASLREVTAHLCDVGLKVASTRFHEVDFGVTWVCEVPSLIQGSLVVRMATTCEPHSFDGAALSQMIWFHIEALGEAVSERNDWGIKRPYPGNKVYK